MSAFRFTEQTPREAGFRQVFTTRIVPILEYYERTRSNYLRRTLLGLAAFGALGFGAAGAGIAFESELGILGVVVSGAGGGRLNPTMKDICAPVSAAK